MPHLFYRSVMIFWWFLGSKSVKSEIILKIIENLQSTNLITILSEIALYTLKDVSMFGRVHIHLKNLWYFTMFFWMGTCNNWTLPQKYSEIRQKKTEITSFSKIITCTSNSDDNFSDVTPFSKTWDDFVGSFGGRNTLKRERNLKAIWKSLKCILTNHFLGNLNIYSK